MEKIGLLAGVGTLPVEFAEAVRSQGYEVVCVAVIPGIDPRLKEIANVYYDISAFKLNKIIKTLVKENVKEVTMIGKVTKEWLYKDHVLPDLRAIKVLNRLRKANFKDDTITLAIVEELAKDGISVLDQTKYLKPLMPGPQVFTKKKPTEERRFRIQGSQGYRRHGSGTDGRRQELRRHGSRGDRGDRRLHQERRGACQRRRCRRQDGQTESGYPFRYAGHRFADAPFDGGERLRSTSHRSVSHAIRREG
jgi:hypothetical protein